MNRGVGRRSELKYFIIQDQALSPHIWSLFQREKSRWNMGSQQTREAQQAEVCERIDLGYRGERLPLIVPSCLRGRGGALSTLGSLGFPSEPLTEERSEFPESWNLSESWVIY